MGSENHRISRRGNICSCSIHEKVWERNCVDILIIHICLLCSYNSGLSIGSNPVLDSLEVCFYLFDLGWEVCKKLYVIVVIEGLDIVDTINSDNALFSRGNNMFLIFEAWIGY